MQQDQVGTSEPQDADAERIDKFVERLATELRIDSFEERIEKVVQQFAAEVEIDKSHLDGGGHWASIDDAPEVEAAEDDQ